MSFIPDDTPFSMTNGLHKTWRDYRGHWLILYFYPKDATPGCTTEGQDFAQYHDAFSALNTTILGVSRDSVKSHESFKAKQQFPFELISDSNETLCSLFDVIKMKSMYGKQVRGIERSTFIIDPQGHVIDEFRAVKVKGHVLNILERLKILQNDAG